MSVENLKYDIRPMLTLPTEYYQYIAQVWMNDFNRPPFALMDTMADWCKDNFGDIGWKIEEHEISIVDIDNAMAFKLRWT